MAERFVADNHSRHEDLVLAVTDALLAGDGVDIVEIAARYGVPPAQVRRYSQLVEQLHRVLLGVGPSPSFVRALKRDLLGRHPIHWRWLALRAPFVLAIVALAGALLTTFARRWRRKTTTADSPNAGK